jgi:hypothetical protein
VVAAVSAELSQYDPSLAPMEKWSDGVARAVNVSLDGTPALTLAPDPDPN